MFYVYILSSRSKVLYIGVTNNIERRMYEHRNKILTGFSAKYNCTKLIYFEEFNNVKEAITREKQLKKWNRSKKINIITVANPNWKDLLV